MFLLMLACANDEPEPNGGNDDGNPAVQQRYDDDLTFVAQPRIPGSGHHAAVQALCAETFEELGFEVERHDFGTGTNVIGVLAGTSDDRVLVGAHYDSVAAGCNGADDNASGVAGVLEVARILAAEPHERTLVVACWDQEEVGLVGARAYADRVVERGETIDVYFNFEMIAFTSEEDDSQQYPFGFDQLFYDQVNAIRADGNKGNFLAVINDEASHDAGQAVVDHGNAIGLLSYLVEIADDFKSSDVFADVRRSDHAPFWDIGVPAMMLTDTSEFRYDGYHCYREPDDVGRLDLDFATKVVGATALAARDALNP